MSLHIELAAAVDETFGQRLARPAEQKQDALVVALDNGVMLTVRYAAPDAYSMRWSYGDAEAGIDTAPLHRELATFPNHLHDANGSLRPDPVTRPDRMPTENMVRLVQALLDDPTLGILDEG
ncbi:hypothetical protein [Aromatoleum sp.]|uniref:hypothetical protein n=1 Tax=Aromatoleum sp. TaxID=2307007 RepID=UPI002FC687CB